MSREKTDEVKIIVAFGDIRGFTDTCERVTSHKLEIAPFFDKFDAITARYERKTGFTFEDTGDGFMCIANLSNGYISEKAMSMLTCLWQMVFEINRAISDMQAPRFSGFRIRLSAGYVLRKVKRDGRVVYRGKTINLAHKILQISKEDQIIAHQSFVELMNPTKIKSAGFRITPLERPQSWPENVSHKDAGMLYVVTPDET